MKKIKMRSCSLLLNKSQLIASRIIVKSLVLDKYNQIGTRCWWRQPALWER